MNQLTARETEILNSLARLMTLRNEAIERLLSATTTEESVIACDLLDAYNKIERLISREFAGLMA